MNDFGVGDSVREIATGRVGVLHKFQWDNSCGDRDCCGGPFPSVAWVIFPDSECPDLGDDFLDDCDGNFAGLERA